MFNNLYEFYRSKEWESFRKVVIAERVKEDGFVYDEVTGKPIVKAYDIILHHKILILYPRGGVLAEPFPDIILISLDVFAILVILKTLKTLCFCCLDQNLPGSEILADSLTLRLQRIASDHVSV